MNFWRDGAGLEGLEGEEKIPWDLSIDRVNIIRKEVLDQCKKSCLPF